MNDGRKGITWKKYLIIYFWRKTNDFKGLLTLAWGRDTIKEFKRTWLVVLGIWITNYINELYWYLYFH